jgi:hypothetical protein
VIGRSIASAPYVSDVTSDAESIVVAVESVVESKAGALSGTGESPFDVSLGAPESPSDGDPSEEPQLTSITHTNEEAKARIGPIRTSHSSRVHARRVSVGSRERL